MILFVQCADTFSAILIEETFSYGSISGFDSGLGSGSVLTETVFPSKEPSL